MARLGPMAADRKQIVRDSYAAFAAGDRSFFEERLSDDFLFSAPPDPKLDRDGYFERCWPGAGRGQGFDFVRLIESGDEVVVTYESDVSAGGRGRNTEVITFNDENKIAKMNQLAIFNPSGRSIMLVVVVYKNTNVITT